MFNRLLVRLRLPKETSFFNSKANVDRLFSETATFFPTFDQLRSLEQRLLSANSKEEHQRALDQIIDFCDRNSLNYERRLFRSYKFIGNELTLMLIGTAILSIVILRLKGEETVQNEPWKKNNWFGFMSRGKESVQKKETRTTFADVLVVLLGNRRIQGRVGGDC